LSSELDSKFKGLDLILDAHECRIQVRNTLIVHVPAPSESTIERGFAPDTHQELLLLRVRGQDGHARAFFIDDDGGTTNVREVISSCETLAATLDWLLPPGYVVRQGDVAFYELEQIPAEARQVTAQEFEQFLYPRIAGRHRFTHVADARFFVLDQRPFLNVAGSIRIEHPEHDTRALRHGHYELRFAQGTPLPERACVRYAKPVFVEV
jgi:hypothetical protein